MTRIKIQLILFLFVFNCINAQNISKERIDNLKKGVVRILIDSESKGTGFIVSEDCKIVTCWHVIEPSFIRDSTGRITSIKSLEIEFNNGEKLEAGIFTILLQEGNYNAVGYDYCLLRPTEKPTTKYYSFKIGSFNQINEGEQVYTCGYPLGIKQQFISQGILSTKWVDTVTVTTNGKQSKINRNVAWLDLTMNRGNSGGPIIKLGSKPDEDEVIGIATFILNPFAQTSDTLFDISSKLNMDIQFGGISQVAVNKLFALAVANNSIGISGCISINHLLDTIGK